MKMRVERIKMKRLKFEKEEVVVEDSRESDTEFEQVNNVEDLDKSLVTPKVTSPTKVKTLEELACPIVIKSPEKMKTPAKLKSPMKAKEPIVDVMT